MRLWCLIIVELGIRGIRGDRIRSFFAFLRACVANVRVGECRTSGMAEDVICLLDTLGWTGTRELHVVGISLGGMIAQGGYIVPFLVSY